MVEAVADEAGHPVALVTDPEGARSRRFAGCWRDPALDGEPEFRCKFRPRAEVRKMSHDLKAAVDSGCLMQLGPVVAAKDHESAEAAILAALKGAEG